MPVYDHRRYPQIILASGSPRRRELLSRFGFPFIIDVSDADEVNTGTPEELVESNAAAKALAVARRHGDALVIASDTLVSLDGEPLGKPADEEDAALMLGKLSGKAHQVFTGVCLIDCATGKQASFVDRSDIRFREMSESEITDYIRTGEPMDKAGAYAIQGLGGKFVESYTGSFENIMGLPVQALEKALKAFADTLYSPAEE